MSKTKDNEVFTAKDSDGYEFTVVVKHPTPAQLKKAKMVGISVANQCIKDGIMPRSRIMDYLVENGCWDDEKEERLVDLANKLRAGERQLSRGGRKEDGSPFTKSEARQLAIDMRRWRIEQLSLLVQQRELDNCSVEGQSDNAQFDYLVSVCCFNEEGKPLFKDMDDYLDKSEEEYAVKCATKLGSMLYSIDEDLEKERPENKFLLNYGFVREDLRLVNENGSLINVEGKLIDEEGRFIDQDGNYVDREGNSVNEDGSYLEIFTEYPDE